MSSFISSIKIARGHLSTQCNHLSISMDVATDLNTKLETALNVEFVVADNLREQIYEAISELNSMTMWPIQSAAAEEASFGSQNDDGLTEPDEDGDGSVGDDEAMLRGISSSSGDTHDAGVKFNCFPNSHTDFGKPVKVIASVPSAKLSYLNHAELLRKYSGI